LCQGYFVGVRPEKRYYVYILTSSSRRALYSGITNHLYKCIDQHKTSDQSTFVGRNRAFRLVYFEVFRNPASAIEREKEIKGWTRAKKEALVRSENPSWKDLSRDFERSFSPEFERKNARSFAPTEGAQDDTVREKRSL
jgi:putative endonuclease